METQPTRAERALKSNPRERGRALVEAWRRSGLSQRAFALQHEVRPQLVSYWSRRFPPPAPTTASVPAPAGSVKVDLVEIQVPTPTASMPAQCGSAIEIRFASGTMVRILPGVDPALLRVVVSALEGLRC